MQNYDNVICQIEILTWKSMMSVSLELECDMMEMPVNTT